MGRGGEGLPPKRCLGLRMKEGCSRTERNGEVKLEEEPGRSGGPRESLEGAAYCYYRITERDRGVPL